MKINARWRGIGWRHSMWDMLRFYSVVRTQGKKIAKAWREKLELSAWFKKTSIRVTVLFAGEQRRIVSGPADPRPAGVPISPLGVPQFRANRLWPSSSSQCGCFSPFSTSAGLLPTRYACSLLANRRWFR